VFSWFAGALIAMTAAGLVATLIYKLPWGGTGLLLAFGLNLAVRQFVSRASNVHENTYHKKATP
jgi:hypothetical protein